MITKEVARGWANMYHNKFSPLHDIELGVLHAAAAGNFTYKYDCPEMYQRALSQSLTQDDLAFLQKIAEARYETKWEEGSLVLIFG